MVSLFLPTPLTHAHPVTKDLFVPWVVFFENGVKLPTYSHPGVVDSIF
jgi:hypothetical protein